MDEKHPTERGNWNSGVNWHQVGTDYPQAAETAWDSLAPSLAVEGVPLAAQDGEEEGSPAFLKGLWAAFVTEQVPAGNTLRASPATARLQKAKKLKEDGQQRYAPSPSTSGLDEAQIKHDAWMASLTQDQKDRLFAGLFNLNPADEEWPVPRPRRKLTAPVE